MFGALGGLLGAVFFKKDGPPPPTPPIPQNPFGGTPFNPPPMSAADAAIDGAGRACSAVARRRPYSAGRRRPWPVACSKACASCRTLQSSR